MQTSQLEKKNHKLSGDEECINFRPSPNFKHMRKYLKSKFDEANSSPNQSSDPSTTPNSEEQESVPKPQQATSSSMAQRVQPPLPPNSPPPEVLIVPKQEVEDDEYNDTSAPKVEPRPEKVDVTEKVPEKTMCRQFARGMCTRPAATCIYAHELILSQLPGVYTFCKNFQNTVCNFPKCKFVHATVFEKERFYRTGYLPPHTLTHLKESNSALGPPAVVEGTVPEGSSVFSNPPPSTLPGVSSLPTSGSAPLDSQPKTELFGTLLSKKTSPSKRDWENVDIGALRLSIQDDPSEPLQKKCKTCAANEVSEQRAKAKLEETVELAEKFSQQKMRLKRWEVKLNSLFDMLLVSGIMKSTSDGSLSSLMSHPSIMRKKEDKIETVTLNQLMEYLQDRKDFSQKALVNECLKLLVQVQSNAARN